MSKMLQASYHYVIGIYSGSYCRKGYQRGKMFSVSFWCMVW